MDVEHSAELVADQWGVRWPNGVVATQENAADARRIAKLAYGVLVKRPVGEWRQVDGESV